MSGFSGADVAQLRALSSRISTQSEKLREIAASSTVALMVAEWTGNDIDAVRSNWRRGSLPTINALAGALREMSAELDKHAAEQERVSGGSSASGRSWIDGIRDWISNWFEKLLVPGGPPKFGSGTPRDGGGGNTNEDNDSGTDKDAVPVPPVNPAPPRFDRDELQRDYDAWRNDGTWKSKDLGWCTSWVEFRRESMDPPRSVPGGNGGLMAPHSGNGPTPGAIVSFPNYGTTNTWDPGHVGIVEAVKGSDPPSFVISEMNAGEGAVFKGEFGNGRVDHGRTFTWDESRNGWVDSNANFFPELRFLP
jgi:surface antigen